MGEFRGIPTGPVVDKTLALMLDWPSMKETP
jgi:hypothetical protein